MSVYSQKISIVSNFSNKVNSGGYSKNKPRPQLQKKNDNVDPDFIKKMEQEEARLKKIRIQNKNKFQEIKQEALKKRIQHTNQEYQKHKEHNRKYSNFVRKKDTQQSSKENLKQKLTAAPAPQQIFQQDSLDRKVFVNQIAFKQQHSKTKNAVNYQNKENKATKGDIFNEQSIQEHIDVDDKIPDFKGDDTSSDQQYKQYYINKSEISNHIPKKLERVQPGKGGVGGGGGGGGKQISSYDQLAYGMQKPPSAKSAARRFNEKIVVGSGSSSKISSNVRREDEVAKLTKDSLKKFDSQIEFKLFPEDNISQNKREGNVALPWAKNQKMKSPTKNQQSQKNQKKNQQIQQKNLYNELLQQQYGQQLPEQATFGKAPGQLDQFTFGKQRLGEKINVSEQQQQQKSKIPRINNISKKQIVQQQQSQPSIAQKASQNRAPSVPTRSKDYKISATAQRNKSQHAIKRKQSEKAISMISERSEKQSISGMSQDTRLQNLRMKYGNPSVKKI